MLKNTKKIISFLIAMMLVLATVSVSASVITVKDLAVGNYGYGDLLGDTVKGFTFIKTTGSITSSNFDVFIGNAANANLAANLANFTAKPANNENITVYDAGKRQMNLEHATNAPANAKKLVVEFDALFFAKDVGYTTPCGPTNAAFVQFLTSSGTNLFSTAYRGTERTDVGQLKGFGHKIEGAGSFTYGSTQLSSDPYFSTAGTVTYRWIFTLDETTSKYKVDFYIKGENDAEWIDINSKFTAYDNFYTSALPAKIKIGSGNVADSLGIFDNFKVYTIDEGNVSAPVMLDTDGNAVTSASAGDSVICAVNTNTAVSSSLVLGAYDSSDYFVGFNNNDVAANIGVNWFRYTIPSDAAKVKLFTLNSFTDIKPYIDAVSFDIN